MTTGGTTAFSSDTADASIDITPQIGSPISVGYSTNASDEAPTLLTAVDGAGTSVVAWQDSDDNLIAQFYSANGAAIGSPMQVNPDGGPAYYPTVSANANGTFAFAWSGSSGFEVQRYQDTDGVITAIDSSPLVITSDYDGDFLDVGITASGGFVVGWSQQADDGTQELLQVQQFNSSGVATTSPTTVATIDDDSYWFDMHK